MEVWGRWRKNWSARKVGRRRVGKTRKMESEKGEGKVRIRKTEKKKN